MTVLVNSVSTYFSLFSSITKARTYKEFVITAATRGYWEACASYQRIWAND